MKRALFTLLFCFAIACGLSAAPYQAYKKDHCEWCLTPKVRLVVHHIESQHLRPDLTNDHPENYVTLCDPVFLRKTGCHYKFGHRGISWAYDNSVLLKQIVKLMEVPNEK